MNREELETKLLELLNTQREEIKELLEEADKLEALPSSTERSTITSQCGCWFDYDSAVDCILHRLDEFMNLRR